MSTNFGTTESSSDAVVSSEPPSNTDIAVTNVVKVGDDDALLDSKAETLTMKPSADHEGGSVIVAQDLLSDARVSVDELGIVTENVEKVLDENGANYEEKEGEYKVSDIVWAKVRCYPWWPGQIFDPSSSTDKARKYSNKKGFLVAYFGDQSFAWNEASKIKPFRKNFCKMEKQSNTKQFCNAVNCALDEVSRRVEFGLACSCLSKEAYDKIKSQVFVNAGIKKEDSIINGGDNFSTVNTFKPANVVRSVQDLAREHFDGYNRLEVLSVRAQLLAFYRWKGYHQFHVQDLIDESDIKLEDNSELSLMEKDKVIEDAKPGSVSEKVSSKKRKLKACDSVPSKKERMVKNVTPKGSASESNGEIGRKKNGSKNVTIEGNGFKEESNNESGDEKSSISSPKNLFRVGDRISRIAKQLSESPLIPKNESKKSKVPKTSNENSTTALILKFANLDSIPSVTNLNEIFSRYGAVIETETEVLKKKNCAKVVFEAQSNAETAFSSAGKFSIFGPSLISYRLDYSPSLRKTTATDKKQNRNEEVSVEPIQVENEAT